MTSHSDPAVDAPRRFQCRNCGSREAANYKSCCDAPEWYVASKHARPPAPAVDEAVGRLTAVAEAYFPTNAIGWGRSAPSSSIADLRVVLADRAKAWERIAELEAAVADFKGLVEDMNASSEAAEAQLATARAAVEIVVKTFETDEAQGYRGKDREYTLTMLRPLLASQPVQDQPKVTE